MVTVKADDKRRVVLPDIEAGQVFAFEKTGNVIQLTPVKPAPQDAPLIHLVKGSDGWLKLPADVQLSDDKINLALRADRDAQ